MFSYDLPRGSDQTLSAAQEHTTEELRTLLESLYETHGDDIELVAEEMKPCEYCGTQHYEEFIIRELLNRALSRTRGDWGLGRRVKPSTVSYSTAEAPSRGFVNAACCGVDAFRQRRVDVHRVRDVVGSRPEFDGEDEFVDDLGALFADDVRSE